MIACPNCHRRVLTRRDIVFSTLTGAARCPACGRGARLDLATRWIMSCVIAILLPNVLLHGGVFYSGHLFLVSIFVILGVWGALSWIVSPLFKLEIVANNSFVDRRKGMLLLAALLISAIIIDGYIRTRID